MKKIRVTIVCTETGEYPGCADLLASYPELDVVSQPISLICETIEQDLAGSDVLVLDEHALRQDGHETLASIHAKCPRIKILLVHEKYLYNNVMQYLSMGIRGFVGRHSMVSQLRRAIPALYSDEVWIPRQMIKSLRDKSGSNAGSTVWEVCQAMVPGSDKVN